MTQFLRYLLKGSSGATAIEYALIAGGISIAIAGAASVLGTDVQSLYQSVANVV